MTIQCCHLLTEVWQVYRLCRKLQPLVKPVSRVHKEVCIRLEIQNRCRHLKNCFFWSIAAFAFYETVPSGFEKPEVFFLNQESFCSITPCVIQHIAKSENFEWKFTPACHINAIVRHLKKKYASLLSCNDLDEKIDTTLMSVRWVWDCSQDTLSLA